MDSGDRGAGTGAAMVVLGKVVRAHGIKGAVRIRPSGAPSSLESHGPLLLPDGREARAKVLSFSKGTALCTLEGIQDRNAAEGIVGAELAVPRSALPLPDEGDFYHADLVGLAVHDPAGREWGRVVAVHNFGAGDLLDVQPREGAPVMVPFTRESVSELDLEAGVAVVDRSWAVDAGKKGGRA